MKYLHLIRSGDDPDTFHHRFRHEFPRYREQDVYAIECVPEDEWAGQILDLLADGTPRTFNRIAIELAGVVSATAFDTSLDHALWALVECGSIEHTYAAPIAFSTVRVRAQRRVS